MRWAFLFLLIARTLFLDSQLKAQTPNSLAPSKADVKSALDQVVTQQLAAFQAGDFTKAYSFAADEIKKLFVPGAFEKMVKEGYPVMLEKAKADFGAALDDGQEGVVFMELTTAAGTQIFRYSFKMENGKWKISGVTQVEEAQPERGASNTA